MRENTGLRLSLVSMLMKMKYGYNQIIERDEIQAAWPPTGDYDRSDEAVFWALAGGRPEASYTTDQRIERDLDESFTWRVRDENGDYIFHRKESACPKCKGSKQIVKRSLSFDGPMTPFSTDVGLKDAIDIEYEYCDCIPAQD